MLNVKWAIAVIDVDIDRRTYAFACRVVKLCREMDSRQLVAIFTSIVKKARG